MEFMSRQVRVSVRFVPACGPADDGFAR